MRVQRAEGRLRARARGGGGSGELPLAGLAAMDEDAAVAALTRVKGFGRWSAEVYLLFALGRADVFPADDLALQAGYQRLAGLPERPKACVPARADGAVATLPGGGRHLPVALLRDGDAGRGEGRMSGGAVLRSRVDPDLAIDPAEVGRAVEELVPRRSGSGSTAALRTATRGGTANRHRGPARPGLGRLGPARARGDARGAARAGGRPRRSAASRDGAPLRGRSPRRAGGGARSVRLRPVRDGRGLDVPAAEREPARAPGRGIRARGSVA